MAYHDDDEEYASEDQHERGRHDSESRARLAERMRIDIEEHAADIVYSNRYSDDENEYRHVTLPKQIARWIPKDRLMPEAEWRSFGVQQSAGWEHYMLHKPEPHILLFRREKDYQQKYGNKPKPVNARPGVGGLAG